MLRTTAFFMVLLLNVLDARADTPPSSEFLILENVKSRLETTGLAKSITIVGVNESGTRVEAKPNKGIDLQELLEEDSGFGKDIFKSGMGHKGSFRSYRQKINPSLQITFFKDAEGVITLELDIDRYGPWWDRPIDTIRHITQEVGMHWVKRKIFGKKPKTCQKAIAKALAREKAQLVATKNP